jgi:MYXO-CTERM domain-containing protein
LRSATDGAGSYQYAQVVLPLSEAIPFWSQYRKFDTISQTWGPYTIDSRNDVKTAPLDVSTGGCPEPGNGSYDRPITGALADKLREDDECVQLTIEDGGANDADGAVNGSVSDPGGVAEVPGTPLPETATGGGGCSVTTGMENPGQHSEWWLLAGLLGFLGWKRRNLKTR